MLKPQFGPGDDVDAWCTRCRMNLSHRIIATVGSTIQRVHCLTCGGDHKYYPPKYDKSDARKDRDVVKISSAAKSASRPDAAAKASARSQGEWSAFMKEMHPESAVRPYKISDSYQPPEFIEHTLFGVGRVLDIVAADKIEVIFQEGRKILICNRQVKAS